MGMDGGGVKKLIFFPFAGEKLGKYFIIYFIPQQNIKYVQLSPSPYFINCLYSLYPHPCGFFILCELRKVFFVCWVKKGETRGKIEEKEGKGKLLNCLEIFFHCF